MSDILTQNVFRIPEILVLIMVSAATMNNRNNLSNVQVFLDCVHDNLSWTQYNNIYNNI